MGRNAKLAKRSGHCGLGGETEGTALGHGNVPQSVDAASGVKLRVCVRGRPVEASSGVELVARRREHGERL